MTISQIAPATRPAIVVWTVSLLSCFGGGAGEVRLTVDHDVIYRRAGKADRQLKAGETVEVTASPSLLEAPGHVSMLVVPVGDQPEELTVSLRPYDEWGGEAIRQQAGQLVDSLMPKVLEIQRLMADGSIDEALHQHRTLEREFGDIPYIGLLKVSLLTLAGRTSEASSLLAELRLKMAETPDTRRLRTILQRSGQAPGGSR